MLACAFNLPWLPCKQHTGNWSLVNSPGRKLKTQSTGSNCRWEQPLPKRPAGNLDILHRDAAGPPKHRKAARAAISSGWMMRFCGFCPAISAIASSSVRPLPSRATTCATLRRISSVSTQVGLIITQVTPCGAPSSATHRVRPRGPTSKRNKRDYPSTRRSPQ